LIRRRHTPLLAPSCGRIPRPSTWGRRDATRRPSEVQTAGSENCALDAMSVRRDGPTDRKDTRYAFAAQHIGRREQAIPIMTARQKRQHVLACVCAFADA